jgi:hypothetical protein
MFIAARAARSPKLRRSAMYSHSLPLPEVFVGQNPQFMPAPDETPRAPHFLDWHTPPPSCIVAVTTSMKRKQKAATKTRPRSTCRSVPPKPSPHQHAKTIEPLFTEAERECLVSKNDYTELDYLVASRIRQCPNPTAHQRERLRQHDDEEAQIKADPESVAREAHTALDRSISLLLKLIRSRSFREEYAEWASDRAFDCLASRISFLNQQLVRLAEYRTPNACHILWYEASALTAAFVRLAAHFPQEFRPVAETSLLMPTLVGPVPEVKTSKALAEAIGLAAKHPAAAVRARQPLGVLCHHLVARIVENILYARSQRDHLERTARYTGAKQIIPADYRPAARRHLEECWALPELHRGADQWWSKKVKPMVHAELERISRDPARNQALWCELKRATDSGSDADKRAALDKYCRNKLLQIANALPAKDR